MPLPRTASVGKSVPTIGAGTQDTTQRCGVTKTAYCRVRALSSPPQAVVLLCIARSRIALQISASHRKRPLCVIFPLENDASIRRQVAHLAAREHGLPDDCWWSCWILLARQTNTAAQGPINRLRPEAGAVSSRMQTTPSVARGAAPARRERATAPAAQLTVCINTNGGLQPTHPFFQPSTPLLTSRTPHCRPRRRARATRQRDTSRYTSCAT